MVMAINGRLCRTTRNHWIANFAEDTCVCIYNFLQLLAFPYHNFVCPRFSYDCSCSVEYFYYLLLLLLVLILNWYSVLCACVRVDNTSEVDKTQVIWVIYQYEYIPIQWHFEYHQVNYYTPASPFMSCTQTAMLHTNIVIFKLHAV